MLSYCGNSTYSGQSNYVLTDTWIVSPKAVNSITGFYMLNKTVNGNVNNKALLSDLGASYLDGGPVKTQPQFTVTGYFTAGTGGSGPITQAQMTTGLEDTFNLTAGNHQIKLGGSFIFNKYHETASFQSSSISELQWQHHRKRPGRFHRWTSSAVSPEQRSAASSPRVGSFALRAG